jgi:hypothetical protein
VRGVALEISGSKFLKAILGQILIVGWNVRNCQQFFVYIALALREILEIIEVVVQIKHKKIQCNQT